MAVQQPRPAVPLRDLPRDARGYLVPAEAPWDEFGPHIAQVNPVLKLALAGYRACSVCGFPLGRGELVWRIFTGKGREVMQHGVSDGASSEYAAPGHLVCMLYSALTCPFWSSERARLGKESTMAPGAVRGEVAALMGFDDYSLIIDPTQPVGGSTSQPLSFLYHGFEREILFRNPVEDLTEVYDRERQRVGGSYVTHRRRHYAPQFGGRRRLTKDVDAAIVQLQGLQPDQLVVFDGVDSDVFQAGWM